MQRCGRSKDCWLPLLSHLFCNCTQCDSTSMGFPHTGAASQIYWESGPSSRAVSGCVQGRLARYPAPRRSSARSAAMKMVSAALLAHANFDQIQWSQMCHSEGLPSASCQHPCSLHHRINTRDTQLWPNTRWTLRLVSKQFVFSLLVKVESSSEWLFSAIWSCSSGSHIQDMAGAKPSTQPDITCKPAARCPIDLLQTVGLKGSPFELLDV